MQRFNWAALPKVTHRVGLGCWSFGQCQLPKNWVEEQQVCLWNYPISFKEKGHILSLWLLSLGKGNAKAGILSEGMSELCDWGLSGKAPSSVWGVSTTTQTKVFPISDSGALQTWHRGQEEPKIGASLFNPKHSGNSSFFAYESFEFRMLNLWQK